MAKARIFGIGFLAIIFNNPIGKKMIVLVLVLS